MTLTDTLTHLLTTRRALTAAESAHAEAIAAEVRASVPGPWVAVPEVGAMVEQGPIRVGVDWSDYKGPHWIAWACGQPPATGDMWHRRGERADDPRAALASLCTDLRRCRSDHGRTALAIVVRLLRGWA